MEHDRHILLRSVSIVFAIFLVIRFGIPWLAVILGLSATPAPVPGFALGIYLVVAVVGTLVYVSSEEGRWRSFLTPIVRAFVLPAGAIPRSQMLALAVLPLVVGGVAWTRVVPATGTPAVLRVQHPAVPDEYAEMINPLAELPEAERAVAVREGVVLYQKNCRPCHGTKADGLGPLSRGLRLKPIDFTDPGTIATVVEPYPFWRITKGGIGLPDIATPWNSAMPAWEEDFTPEEIWRILSAEYEIAGTEPRRPEGAER